MEEHSSPSTRTEKSILREPVAEDGPAVHRLISASPPLDTNSLYCNLLQCTHFSGTCVVAEQNNTVVGYASAYLLPDQSHTLFIWQIAVDESVRGQGLAKRMLLDILRRPKCEQVNYIETTISPGNTASWRLFRSLAEDLNATCSERTLFDRQTHFDGQHPDETLLQISSEFGPFTYYLQSIEGKQA